jgi:hypothetical protein
MKNNDHRIMPRTPSSLTGVVRSADRSVPRPDRALISNMSMRGAFIETLLHFDVGEMVLFDLLFPRMGQAARITGVVRWCSNCEPQGVGVEMLQVS